MCLAIASNLPPVFLTTFGEVLGGPQGLSEEQLGRIPGLIFGGFVAGLILTSPVADRCGAKWFAVGGLAMLCAGLVLLATARTYAALQFAVFTLGSSAGILEVVMSPVAAALQPHRRTSALNLLHSFYSIGAVGCVLVGSAALRFGVSWRIVSLALIAAPACVLLGFLRVGTLPLVHEDAAAEPARLLLRRPFFLAAVMLIGLGGATEIGMAQWLPAYAERGLGYSKAAGGLALAAFSVAMMVGRIAIGVLAARVSPALLMMAGSAASIALILAGCFLPYPPMALLACISLGLTVCCFWPTTLAMASDRFPRGGAFMFGVLAAGGNTGCMIMPWVVGAVAERTSLSWGLASMTVCPLIMVAVLSAIGVRHRRRLAQAGIVPPIPAPE